MMISRRYQRIVFICILIWALLYFSFNSAATFTRDAAARAGLAIRPPGQSGGHAISKSKDKTKGAKPEEKELVVASLSGDDMSWLDQFFGEWKKNIYVVNNRSAPLTVSVNKGREAMPFLTYARSHGK